MQARALAAAGGTVAVLDPRGTGDSGGDHGDASWHGWCQDVGVAWRWLGGQSGFPPALWGLRLGALLALDAMANEAIEPAALLLWQPVASGKQWFSQFLRTATAQQITRTGEGGLGAKVLHSALAAGSSIEIAGYGIASDLVGGAETVDLVSVAAPRCTTLVREVSLSSPPTLSPAVERVVMRWTAAGVRVDAAAIVGPSFWAAQEIAEAPALITATTAALSEALTSGTMDRECRA